MKRVLLLLLLALALAGCGSLHESNQFKLPDPNVNVRMTWIRIDTPSNYPTVVHACYGPDGIYLNQDTSNTTTVVPNDPQCKK